MVEYAGLTTGNTVRSITRDAVFTGLLSLLQVLAAVCYIPEYAPTHRKYLSPLWAAGTPLKMER